AAFAASTALTISDIPWGGPISEVRGARVVGKVIVNPVLADKERADIDWIVAASIENLLMVEGEMKEVSEDDMLEALKIAHDAIKVQCQLQLDMAKELGKTVKRTYNHEVNDENLREELSKLLYSKVYAVAKQQIKNKKERG